MDSLTAREDEPQLLGSNLAGVFVVIRSLWGFLCEEVKKRKLQIRVYCFWLVSKAI